MKIALAQLNYHIGNFEANTAKIITNIQKAKEAQCDLIIFSELAISGYPARDFLEFSDFIAKCRDSAEQIREYCTDIAAIVGLPTVNPNPKGKSLFNSAALISGGKISQLHHKSLLPNYDVFDEYRYFEPNTEFSVAELNGRRIAITVCEDLWNISDDPMYTQNPMDELIRQHPDFIVNIAASPFHYDQAALRKEILTRNVNKYQIPLFYVNQVGAHTELIFDGVSMVLSADGSMVSQLDFFREDFKTVFLEDAIKIKNEFESSAAPSKIGLIHDALVMGIENYFSRMGFSKAILGLSGGIDSAVTLVLAAKALGSKNCRAVLMPSRFSSEHSISDAVKLAENLGVPYDIISIEDAFQSFRNTLQPIFGNLPFDLAEENIQARVRGVILMAISNKFNYILLNTSNKSEAAVGYGTLYGDMNGGLSVLGDLYKTQVYDLSRFINRETEVIPENTISKPPSAELRPNQKDSDSLPEYGILDDILFNYIENRKGPDELVKMGFDEKMVKRVCRLVNISEYKRHQTPPILRVSPKAFGMGRRMPIVAKYLS